MSVTTDQLLDCIFRDPKTKHKLDLFTPQEKKRLQLFEKGGKIRIRCMARNRDFVAKPEEVVRQLVLIRLHYTLDYPIAHLDVEAPVKMGSGYGKKAADIVVYRAPHKITPYIIVEVKKPGRKDGREQLHSYMNATGAPFGMWTNGSGGMQGVAYELRTEPNLYAELPRLPAHDETLDDVLEPIHKKDLQPAEDLIGLVKQMQEEVLANAGGNVFEEVFKLFFVKLWDEESASDLEDDSGVCQFRITADEPEAQYPRFKRLLDDACAAYPDIFPPGTDFDLSPEALMVAASVLERIRLTDTDLELVDLTFEYLMSPESKGDKGQYFTPRQVIRMAVKMLNPKSRETMLDPACGPCGFPIHTLLHVRDQEIRQRYPYNWEPKVQDYGQRYLFAADFDPRAVRVAKFIMRLAGDGRTNIYRMNSLDPREWKRDQAYQKNIAGRQFDVIMTNPPFAGTIRHPQILNHYDLAFTETRKVSKNKEELRVVRQQKRQPRQTRDVLFLDYCLNKLAPGGRMAIVLPQGHFNNVSAEQTRRYIMSRARILGVVGLHVNAFKPHTGTKTSVLFVQRWAGEAADAWRSWYDELYEYERQAAEYEALRRWREKLLDEGKTNLPPQIREEPPPPGDPPPPPDDYPIFFATSQRSGRDNSGKYDWLKDEAGNVVTAPKTVLVHDERGLPVETVREVPVLNTDLDDIADAFIAWGQEQNLDFLAGSPCDGRSFSEIVAGAKLAASNVWVSKLEQAIRIDAEYYQPDYLRLAQIVSGGDLLVDLAAITHPTEITRIYAKEGIQILLAQNIRKNRLDFSTKAFFPESTRPVFSRNLLEFDDVVMTRSGANFGETAVYKGHPDELFACADVLIIRPQNIPGGYLSTYFNTTIGCALLNRGAYGLAQPHIAPSYLYSMRIPRGKSFSEKEIDQMVTSAYEQLEKSKRLYREAEELLLDALDTKNLDLSSKFYDIATLNRVIQANRIDTNYFENRYSILINHLVKYGAQPLYQFAYLRQEHFSPQKDTPFEYIEISDVDLSNGLCWSKRLAGENAPDRAQQIVRAGDLIVSTVRPLRGGTALIQPTQDGFVCSSGFAVLRPRRVSPEYLLVYLRLQLVRELINRDNRASMYPAVTAQDILQIPVVLFPDIESKIQTKVYHSHQAFFDAIELLEQAKELIEKMIKAGDAHG